MKKLMCLLAVVVLSGCSSMHVKTLSWSVPDATPSAKDARPIVIETVRDDRQFSNSPLTNGPRLAQVGMAGLTPSSKSTMIGGAYYGVVTLAQGGTVEARIRSIVSSVLVAHGYRLVSNDQAAKETPRITISISEFWSGVPVSFGRALTWTQQMKAWLATTITVQTGNSQRQFEVKGEGAHIIQTGKDENWRHALDLAMSDYEKNLSSKMFTSM